MLMILTYEFFCLPYNLDVSMCRRHLNVFMCVNIYVLHLNVAVQGKFIFISVLIYGFRFYSWQRSKTIYDYARLRIRRHGSIAATRP